MTLDAHVSQETLPLTLRESVALVHAVVDHLARQTETRALFIKGPFLAHQGLRSDDHLSVDVDVLVSPDQFHLFCGALEDAGWRDLHPLDLPTIVPQHSRTYRHDRWECTVDVHRLFPGFLTEPQTVFDALWRSRTTVEVACLPLPTTDRVGNAAVAGLHYLRDGVSAYRAGQLDELVDHVVDGFDDEALAALSLLAAETGAADTMRPFLERVGAPLPAQGASPAAAWSDWQLRSQTPDLTSIAWVRALRRAPMRRRPRLLWLALVLSEEELRAKDPGMSPGRLALARARAARLRRGLRALPTAVAALRRAGGAR